MEGESVGNEHGNVSEMLTRIKRVSTDELASIRSDGGFVSLALDIVVEVASYCCIAANARPTGGGGFDRNSAIVVGNVVRLYKLFHGFLDQVSQGRGELAFIFSRLCFETIVNIRYLMKFGDDVVFSDYVLSSMNHERKLWNAIERNIAERGGKTLPIETRMMQSIHRSVDAGGVDIEALSAKLPKSWGEVNLYERAAKVGLGDAYQAAFSGGSHYVHGSWQDLLDNHLAPAAPGFIGEPAWSRPRPQYMLAISTLATTALFDFFEQVVEPEEFGDVEKRLSDLQVRIVAIDEAHEDFLSTCGQRHSE